MRKLFLVLLALFFWPKNVNAADFLVSSEVAYEALENDNTLVTHNISLVNTSTEVHATDYTLSLSGAQISELKAFEDTKKLEVSQETLNGSTTIKVLFAESVVGMNKERRFSIQYIDSSVIQKTGEVREILIPKLANMEQFNSYKLKIVVPNSFGELAYISPPADNTLTTQNYSTYYFDKKETSALGISAAFGKFQAFSFDISYHLQNPLAIPSKMEIALVPDTSFQKVSHEVLTPLPQRVYEDLDGNWIAVYNLAPRERVDVKSIGTVQVFASPWKIKPVGQEALAKSLLATPFWQVNDPLIARTAQELKSMREIYDFVVSTLDYNYEKVGEGAKRAGAANALNSPENSISTEYTDLFIALSRASGIPAREVNGFAYTDNSTLKPISLVADVLHAWPEYWDNEKKLWTPVDPTWGSTTGGVDYFSKLDLRHIAFVMHGVSSTDPIPPGSYKLGANPQKDVFISFAEPPEKKEQKPNVNYFQKTTLPFQGVKLVAEITNPGPEALYDQKLELSFDGSKKYERLVSILLPFETRRLEFEIPYSEVKLKVGEAEYSFVTDKKPALIRDVIAIATIAVIILALAYLIYRRKQK